ncbi:hypothetical protein Scep_024721 [Stephania cephalantha]|uniref:Amine oxidase domain-containing protein n=2 Tax=Stephania cephalantha TaxID=152367 RepID=A0AAP0EYC9_9MAGN
MSDYTPNSPYINLLSFLNCVSLHCLVVLVNQAKMVTKKAKIVIIGAGMSGLVAANKLYTSPASRELFEICIVEGGNRIGGRIHTMEFGGNRIEMGATWIHGIGGSPIHKIAKEIGALESEQPWEHMDGSSEEQLVTVVEGGFRLDLLIVDRISNLYRKMIEFARGKLSAGVADEVDYYRIAIKAIKMCSCNNKDDKSKSFSLGSFLRHALRAYHDSAKDQECSSNGYNNWSRSSLEDTMFAVHENAERAHTSAGDLSNLDYNAEREYVQFPDEEITISKGYSSIIESIASVLPTGLIQLSTKVVKIEWQVENESESRPVRLHFSDGSTMAADHVIVTVSLGVLKAGIQNRRSGMLFSPPLPSFKADSISKLGFGVVNKLFLQLDPTTDHGNQEIGEGFPFLQMAFHKQESELRDQSIPWWMRRTASLCPIYMNSNVLLSWFAGKEALELESLSDEEMINGVSTTINSFLCSSQQRKLLNSHKYSNGHVNSLGSTNEFKFTKVLKSQWGLDPLFMGSYSYVAVGSSGDDLDKMAEPLPSTSNSDVAHATPPLQILFAGEATHRTQYSTTHGAYFSGLREANRLLQHYHHHHHQ